MFYQLKLKDHGYMTVSLTRRPIPILKRCYFLFHSAHCFTVPHLSAIYQRTEQQKRVVKINVARGLMVLWQQKEKKITCS